MSDPSLLLQNPLPSSDREKDANSPYKHRKAFPRGNTKEAGKQHHVHFVIRRGGETMNSPVTRHDDAKLHLQAELLVSGCSRPHRRTGGSSSVVLVQPEGFAPAKLGSEPGLEPAGAQEG